MLYRQITVYKMCLYYSPKERGRKEGKESIVEYLVHDFRNYEKQIDLLHLWFHGIQQNVCFGFEAATSSYYF